MGSAKLIVADEPTPGLDLDTAKETLKHFRELADNGAAVLLITHDISLAINVADRIAFFYAGTTIETAPADDFRAGKDTLRHPYSKEFIDALPENGFKAGTATQPCPCFPYEGCRFAERCVFKTDECSKGEIPMRSLRGGEVRCLNAT
jgi:peptide/nickel transport system ATP-binding protein